MCDSAMDAIEGTNAVVIVTEWPSSPTSTWRRSASGWPTR